ncbi:MAG: MFS transporter [Chitinophagaceae bacterium]|nr:MFS transporter [Chitinophagaceae bacterium]
MKLSTFNSLYSRNYRLYFYGQFVSLIGTWMQRTAVSWVVYTLTHSAFMLGLTFFAGQFPSFLLGLFGGVVSDRYNRFRVLLTTQFASLLQASTLAVLILLGDYKVWELLALSVFLGCINAFDVPARQALVYEMVDDKADIPNALALNSSMVNLARLIGPAMAGVVLEKLGAGTCFILNAASFIAVIGSLLRMRLPAYKPKVHDKKVFTEMKEGFQYLKQTPSIAKVILMLAIMSLLVIPYATMMPVYAKVIFKGDATTFGYIDSFIGLGAVTGALYLASLPAAVNRRKILWQNTILFGIGLILFSYTAWFPLAMVFAMVSGFGMMAQTTITNTIIQTTVAPDMRGRVISFFAMAYFGLQPLGSLLIGTVSQHIGAPATLLSEGIAALIIVGIFWKYLREKEPLAEEPEHISIEDGALPAHEELPAMQ